MKYYLLIVGILLVGLVSAQVTINENPITISQKVGESHEYQILINNTYNYSVFDFKFGNLTDMGFTFGNTTIEANSTKIINITVNPTSAFDGESKQKVKFNFYTDIPTEITTYSININQDGFDQTYLPMRVGDTIIFHNKDTIVHNVFSSFFNESLSLFLSIIILNMFFINNIFNRL